MHPAFGVVAVRALVWCYAAPARVGEGYTEDCLKSKKKFRSSGMRKQRAWEDTRPARRALPDSPIPYNMPPHQCQYSPKTPFINPSFDRIPKYNAENNNQPTSNEIQSFFSHISWMMQHGLGDYPNRCFNIEERQRTTSSSSADPKNNHPWPCFVNSRRASRGRFPCATYINSQ